MELQDQNQDTGAQAADASTSASGQAPPAQSGNTSDAGSQAPPADDSRVAKLNAENASWRHKVRDLEAQLAQRNGEFQTLQTQVAELAPFREQAGTLATQLQATHLDNRLRADLGALGVVDRGKQDLLIAATRGQLAVTFNDSHQPEGDFSETLKAAVQTLGIGQASTPSGQQAPSGNPLRPAPITRPATGPMTYEERQAQGHATLARTRAGYTE